MKYILAPIFRIIWGIFLVIGLYIIMPILIAITSIIVYLYAFDKTKVKQIVNEIISKNHKITDDFSLTSDIIYNKNIFNYYPETYISLYEKEPYCYRNLFHYFIYKKTHFKKLDKQYDNGLYKQSIYYHPDIKQYVDKLYK